MCNEDVFEQRDAETKLAHVLRHVVRQAQPNLHVAPLHAVGVIRREERIAGILAVAVHITIFTACSLS